MEREIKNMMMELDSVVTGSELATSRACRIEKNILQQR